eukprot:15003519-Alexandrium_andersonii.AAC.1
MCSQRRDRPRGRAGAAVNKFARWAFSFQPRAAIAPPGAKQRDGQIRGNLRNSPAQAGAGGGHLGASSGQP